MASLGQEATHHLKEETSTGIRTTGEEKSKHGQLDAMSRNILRLGQLLSGCDGRSARSGYNAPATAAQPAKRASARASARMPSGRATRHARRLLRRLHRRPAALRRLSRCRRSLAPCRPELMAAALVGSRPVSPKRQDRGGRSPEFQKPSWATLVSEATLRNQAMCFESRPG